MDPDKTLATLRELTKQVLDGDRPVPSLLAEELAESFEALDQWLTKQGFPPGAWAPRW